MVGGRLKVRIHLTLPLAVGLTLLVPGDLWLRYLLLLATLLLHELGHAGAALLLGGNESRISIWPVFGRAEVEAFPDRRSAWVALSAPAANLLCAGLLLGAGGGATLSLGTAPLLDLAFTANLLMGVGNLLPFPPVDGGRALVALRRSMDVAP